MNKKDEFTIIQTHIVNYNYYLNIMSNINTKLILKL